MASIYTNLYLIVFSISLMLLISLGLAVIFGMMKVINLAHGEFMMVGGYACVLSVNAGARRYGWACWPAASSRAWPASWSSGW